jgi:hypothetical protein
MYEQVMTRTRGSFKSARRRPVLENQQSIIICFAYVDVDSSKMMKPDITDVLKYFDVSFIDSID